MAQSNTNELNKKELHGTTGYDSETKEITSINNSNKKSATDKKKVIGDGQKSSTQPLSIRDYNNADKEPPVQAQF